VVAGEKGRLPEQTRQAKDFRKIESEHRWQKKKGVGGTKGSKRGRGGPFNSGKPGIRRDGGGKRP